MQLSKKQKLIAVLHDLDALSTKLYDIREELMREIEYTPDDLIVAIEAAKHHGKKIDAIKIYRQIHGVGLVEAKEAVESLLESHNETSR